MAIPIDREYLEYRKGAQNQDAMLWAEEYLKKADQRQVREALANEPQPKGSWFQENIADPFAYGPAKYFNLGMKHFAHGLDAATDVISRVTGWEKGKVFEAGEKAFSENAEYWDDKIKNEGWTDKLLGQFIGGSIPGIAEFMLGVPWASVRGYAESGSLRGAVHAGAERFALGKIIHAANALSMGKRVVGLGAVGAGQHKMAGGNIMDPEGALAIAQMAGYGLMGGVAGKPPADLFPFLGKVREGYQAGGVRSSSSARDSTPRRSATADSESRDPFIMSSGTDMPGPARSQRPSRQTSGTKPTPGTSETRQTSPETSQYRGNNISSTEITPSPIDKILPSEGFVNPNRTKQTLSRDARELKTIAAEKQVQVDKDLAEIAELVKGEPGSRLKGDNRIEEKIRQNRPKEPGYGPEHLTDYLGARIIDDPMNKLPKIVKGLEKKGYKVSEPEDFFSSPNDWGYRGIYYDVKDPDGFIFEFQVHMKGADKLIDECHRTYEKWRTEAANNSGIVPEHLKPAYLADVLETNNKWAKLATDYIAETGRGKPGKRKRGPGPVITGEASDLIHSKGKDSVLYEIRELDKIIPSHDVRSGFTPNKAFPKGAQERQYHSKPNEQAKVIRHAQRFDERFVVTDNPDSVNGPPIITNEGIVLGGNSRAMTLDLVYRDHPTFAQAYKDRIKRLGPALGFDAETLGKALEGYEKPALVRRVRDAVKPEALPEKIRLFNQSFTESLSPMAEGISRGKMVSDSTMKGLAGALDEHGTLREYLNTSKSRGLVEALVKDGALEDTQVARLTNQKTGLLNNEGKALVEGMLRGRVVENYDLIDGLLQSGADAIVKLDRALPALARIQARGGPWDLTKNLQGALEEYLRYRIAGYKSVDAYLAQGRIPGSGAEMSPEREALFRAVAELKQLQFKGAMEEYARAAELDVEGQETLAFFQPETPEGAFSRVFTEDQVSLVAEQEVIWGKDQAGADTFELKLVEPTKAERLAMMPKAGTARKKRAVFPDEKTKGGTEGKQTSFLEEAETKAGETYTLFEEARDYRPIDYERRVGRTPSAYSGRAADFVEPGFVSPEWGGKMYLVTMRGEQIRREGLRSGREAGEVGPGSEHPNIVEVTFNQARSEAIYDSMGPEAEIFEVAARRGARGDYVPESDGLRFLPEDVWIVQEAARSSRRQGAEQLSLLEYLDNAAKEPAPVDSIKGPLVETHQKTGITAKTLGATVARHFKAKGNVDLTGHTIKRPGDLAELAQVFRDPRFETVRVFYTKKGAQGEEIVGQEAVTTRQPTSVSGDPAMLADKIGPRMQELKADGYWLMHNHPSGVPAPSPGDLHITSAVAQKVPGFREHLVIDGPNYGRIRLQEKDPTTAEWTVEYRPDVQSIEYTDPLKAPLIDHPALNQVVTNPRQVVALGKKIKTDPGTAVVFYADQKLNIRMVQEVDVGALVGEKGLRWLTKQARSIGAARPILYLEGGIAETLRAAGKSPDALNSLYESGTVQDIISPRTSMSQAGGRVKVAETAVPSTGWEGAQRTRLNPIIGGRGPEWASIGESATQYIPNPMNLKKPLVEFVERTGKDVRRYMKNERFTQDLPYSININHAKLDAPERVHEVIRTIANAFPERIHEARRGQVSHETTRKLAQALNMTPQELLQRRRGEAYNAHEATAAMELMLQSAENLAHMRDKVRGLNATDKDRFNFLMAFDQHMGIQEQVSGAVAEAGRTLNALKMIKGVKQSMIDLQIRDWLQGTNGAAQADRLAEMLDGIDRLEGVNTAVRQGHKATLWDMLFEARVNGLLANPTTHVVNLLGSEAAMLYTVPERALAAEIGTAMATEGGVARGEATYMLHGMMEGFKDGLRLAARTFKTGEPSDPMTKLEVNRRRAITSKNLGLENANPYGIPVGKAIDWLAENVVRLSGRGLLAGDELMKATAYRMELNALAMRTARQKGLEGRELALEIERIKRDPADYIARNAQEFSRIMTWTNELGEAGKAMNRAITAVPGLRFVAPFRRTPMNLIKFVAKRTPLAPLARETRAAIQKGGADRDLALAQIGMGTMVMLLAGQLSSEGVITGGGPTNPDMRKFKYDTGWQPYSVKIGNQYFAYSRTDPLGSIVGLSADVAEILNQLDDMSAEDLATASVMAVSKNIMDKTYLRGIAELVEAVQDPDRYGERFVSRFATSFLPGVSGVRAVERLADPEMRYVDGVLDEFKASIPGYSKDLPPRVNMWGEPIAFETAWYDLVNPFYHSSGRKAEVSREILAQDVTIGMPQKIIQGVKLMPWEYHRYVQLAGAEPIIEGTSCHDALKELIKTPEYQRQTSGADGGKAYMLRKTVLAYRAYAREILLAETPALRHAVEAAEREARAALLPNQ